MHLSNVQIHRSIPLVIQNAPAWPGVPATSPRPFWMSPDQCTSGALPRVLGLLLSRRIAWADAGVITSPTDNSIRLVLRVRTPIEFFALLCRASIARILLSSSRTNRIRLPWSSFAVEDPGRISDDKFRFEEDAFHREQRRGFNVAD